MKNKKTIVSLALIIAVLVLGIGYAALSQTLTVNGTANLAKDEFDVEYVTTGIETGTNVESASATKYAATVEVNLSRVENKQAVQEFTIQNLSPELYAKFDGTFTITYGASKESSDYITVTPVLSKTTLNPKGTGAADTATLTVTVDFKEGAPVIDTDDKTETFTISFDAEAAEKAS